MELINRGFLQPGNREHERVVFSNMNLESGDSDYFAQLERDKRMSLDKIRRMKQGEQIPVFYYNNHAVELAELNKIRNGPEFNELHPAIQEMFHQKAREHEQFYLSMQGQQISVDPQLTQQNPMQQGMAGQGGAPAQTPVQQQAVEQSFMAGQAPQAMMA